jgi:hypothetical protein
MQELNDKVQPDGTTIRVNGATIGQWRTLEDARAGYRVPEETVRPPLTLRRSQNTSLTVRACADQGLGI